MNKKRNSRTLKLGTYSTLIVVAALVLAIVINLLAAEIPADKAEIDMTSNRLYSLSDQSRQIVSGLEEDVYIYLMAETGKEAPAVTELLDRYAPLSDRLHIEYKDPVIYPNFAAQLTEEDISANSLIVTSAKRTKVIHYNEIVVTSYGMTASGGYTSSTSYEGESQITSAIDYVVSGSLPVLYSLTGHGEQTLDTRLQSAVAAQNISLETLNLANYEAVPEDADCLLLPAPASDYTPEDISKLRAYMESGGSLILLSLYTGEEQAFPNLYGFMAEYGLSVVPGLVLDADINHVAYTQSGAAYLNFLMPDMNDHAITEPIREGGYYVLYPNAQGIQVADSVRSTLTVTELLTTSDQAYSKQDPASETYEKEAGDIDGPFALAAAVEDSKYGGKLVWYTTYYMLLEDYDNIVAGGNTQLLMNTLNWTCSRESGVTIPTKSLSTEYLQINAADGRALNIFFIGILPVGALVLGGVIWFRRKKR